MKSSIRFSKKTLFSQSVSSASIRRVLRRIIDLIFPQAFFWASRQGRDANHAKAHVLRRVRQGLKPLPPKEGTISRLLPGIFDIVPLQDAHRLKPMPTELQQRAAKSGYATDFQCSSFRASAVISAAAFGRPSLRAASFMRAR